MQGFAQYADWFYLIGAVLFILTLRGLSGPKTAIMGNRYGMAGMALAVITTFFSAPSPVVGLIVAAMVAGAAIGIYRAKTVPMTQMPETVAMMHSLVGQNDEYHHDERLYVIPQQWRYRPQTNPLRSASWLLFQAFGS